MESIIHIIIYGFIGLLSGFLSGMLGIGGGLVRTPLLYLVGLPLRTAYGINFFVIPFSSSVAAFAHRKNIAKEIVFWATISGVLGALVGAFHVGFIPPKLLAIIYVLLYFFVSFGIFWDRIFPTLAKKVQPSKKNYFIASFIVNYISGLRGGSAGVIYPALFKTLGLETRSSIATSLCVTIFTSLGAIPIYWVRGELVWLPAIAVLIGSMAGARIGSIFSLKTKPKWLEIGHATIIIILTFSVLIKAMK